MPLFERGGQLADLIIELVLFVVGPVERALDPPRQPAGGTQGKREGRKERRRESGFQGLRIRV